MCIQNINEITFESFPPFRLVFTLSQWMGSVILMNLRVIPFMGTHVGRAEGEVQNKEQPPKSM